MDNPITWTLLSNHSSNHQDNTQPNQQYNNQTNIYQPLRNSYCPPAKNDYYSDQNQHMWKGDFYQPPPTEDWQIVNHQRHGRNTTTQRDPNDQQLLTAHQTMLDNHFNNPPKQPKMLGPQNNSHSGTGGTTTSQNPFDAFTTL